MAGPAAPAGYAVRRERGARVVALPSVLERVLSCIAAHGTLYDAAAARVDAQPFTGRGAAYRMSMPDGDWLVRHYRRGGAVAHVLMDEYVRAGMPRPVRELRASVLARHRGVDTPEILAAVTYPSGVIYRADLATRFIPDSADLASVAFGSAVEPDDTRTRARARVRLRAGEPVRLAAWLAAGVLLRSAFTAGVEHADLNLRNILIAGDPDAPRALLLDLDRAFVRDRAVSAASRSRMLERLHRSRLKLEQLAGTAATTEELAALDAGLAGVDG